MENLNEVLGINEKQSSNQSENSTPAPPKGDSMYLDVKKLSSSPITTFGIIWIIIAIIFMCIGFHKLWFYENPEYGTKINAYVGGDAYNYIINAGKATAYFVTSLAFMASAFISISLKHYKHVSLINIQPKVD